MPRIAVIAVHGVADQQPRLTARAAAGLLLGHESSRYSAFREDELRIELKRLEVGEKVDTATEDTKTLSSKVMKAFEQRGEVLNLAQKGTDIKRTLRVEGDDIKDEPDPGDPTSIVEHDKMRAQLQDFAPNESETDFETVRLHGRRLDDQGNGYSDVDVYEMYWADLSRLRNSLLSVFLEFYLLLFFLSRVGGNTLDWARACYRENSWWNGFAKLHTFGEVALTIAIPVLNLCLLSLLVVVVPFLLPPEILPDVFHVLPIVIVIVSLTALLYTCRKKLDGRRWAPAYAVMLLAVAAISFAVPELGLGPTSFVVILWLVLAGLLLWLFGVYQKRRPGALPVAVASLVLTLGVFGYHLYVATGETELQYLVQAAYATTPILLAFLTVIWGLFFGSTILAALSGLVAVCKTEKPEKPRARRVAWTGDLSLVLPGSLVLIMNLALWHVLAWGLCRLDVVKQNDYLSKAVNGISELLLQNTAPLLHWGLAMLAIGIGLAAWSILPAAISEKRTSAESADASWLGNSLSAGFRWMRVSGEAFRLFLFMVPMSFLFLQGINNESRVLAGNVILAVGVAIVFVISSSRGPFKFLALGFRAALDIAMDVANWLTDRPKERTPRARICQRYASLLRHIVKWRDPHGDGGYDSIVIVSHSQGTVITADLLRFMYREYRSAQSIEPELAELMHGGHRPPIYFMTMGSPLRQLYNLRFPHQYGWVGIDHHSSIGLGPNPDLLGVAAWSNAYRSGDYVGRHLWHRDGDDEAWKTRWTDHDDKRRECCVGVGGHVRYWDSTASEVAAELDRLIHRAQRDSASNKKKRKTGSRKHKKGSA